MENERIFNVKKCLICKRPNNCLHWHSDADTGEIWVWCIGRCQRGYSLRSYCHTAGIDLKSFLENDFDFEQEKPNEVSKLDWPNNYISLSDPRAEKGIEYIKSRGLEPKGDMYFDLEYEAIVFPYYYHNTFAGAQLRLIEPWTRDGEKVKILTMPGTRLGLLFYNWNQTNFLSNTKALVVCEGSFNAISIQNSLNSIYGGILKNPYKVISTSGCGLSGHQIDKLKEIKNAGIRVICAFDSDDAGLKGLSKMVAEECITHYSMTEDTSIDWNDYLKLNNEKELAKLFLGNIKSI